MMGRVKIGLEVHIYPRTKSKLFCTCSSNLSDDPNTNICPICTGQPGSKPMGINENVLNSAIKLALALKFNIENTLVIQRKHYFYPDLPNNYQKTSKPIGLGGKLSSVNFSEIHIEEDPGRYNLREGTVDYNRSGVPLIELVTEPCIKSPKQARDFLVDLRDLLEYLEIVSGKNIFKVDTNVSVGSERVEIKNVNSIKNVERVLEYEIKRQENIINNGEEVSRETRHFDEVKQKTLLLREKETAEDYRYIPDPDIPISNMKKIVSEVKKTLPEDLFKLRKEFIKKYKIDKETSRVITCNKKIREWFEHLSKKIEPNFVASWIKKVLVGELNYRGISLNESNLNLKDVETLLLNESGGKTTPHKSVRVLRNLLDGGTLKRIKKIDISKEKIDEAVDSVLERERDAVKKYLNGKESVFNFLLGEVNKMLGFAVPVHKISKVLKQKLKIR